MTKEKADEILQSVVSTYETIADHFSTTRANLWDELLSVRDYATDGMRVVDVGCGNGRMLQLFKGKRISYVGIDNSAKLLAKAQLFAKQFPEVKSEFILSDTRKLPCDDSMFHITLCIATLHHIPLDAYRLQSVKELFRVTEKGGRLFMTNWDIGRQARYATQQLLQRIVHPSLYRGLSRRDFLIPWTLPDKKVVYRYYYAFREKEITSLLATAGFQDIIHNKSHSLGWVTGNTRRNIVTLARKPH